MVVAPKFHFLSIIEFFFSISMCKIKQPSFPLRTLSKVEFSGAKRPFFPTLRDKRQFFLWFYQYDLTL